MFSENQNYQITDMPMSTKSIKSVINPGLRLSMVATGMVDMNLKEKTLVYATQHYMTANAVREKK